MQLGPVIFIRCFIRALIGVNSITGCEIITPSLIKGNGKQSSFPNKNLRAMSIGEE